MHYWHQEKLPTHSSFMPSVCIQDIRNVRLAINIALEKDDVTFLI